MIERNNGLVQVRTPTYRRPEMLRRALCSLLAQSWSNWVADVFDDDPDQSGRLVCDELADDRIRYHHNAPQKFASKNIDSCFTAANPNDADYFCVVEDDNFLLPEFMTENIRLCRDAGVEIVLRNQLIEHLSGAADAHLSVDGVLDYLFVDGRYEPDQFRMSLLIGIGVSNGGLFWSREATSELEIGFQCTATMQEYMRTFSIREPIYVAMQPLAVWAENAEQTTRNAELRVSYFRREIDLKRHVQALQRLVWQLSPPDRRRTFLSDQRFSPEPTQRSRSLTKALIVHPPSGLAPRDMLELTARGVAIRCIGKLSADFKPFLQSRLTALGAPR